MIYIKRKGQINWHAAPDALTFDGYVTLCGVTLPPRDLSRATEKRPEAIEYCGECHRKEES